MFGFGKRIERTITIDDEGNVVDITDGKQTKPPKPPFSFASFFGRPYNDNGREYNPESGFWEYTEEINGNGDPLNVIEGYGADTATDGTC